MSAVDRAADALWAHGRDLLGWDGARLSAMTVVALLRRDLASGDLERARQAAEALGLEVFESTDRSPQVTYMVVGPSQVVIA